jgi:hypothetical protein
MSSSFRGATVAVALMFCAVARAGIPGLDAPPAVTWVPLHPASAPGPRMAFAMAYDPVS